jgi:hypothetical protein
MLYNLKDPLNLMERGFLQCNIVQKAGTRKDKSQEILSAPTLPVANQRNQSTAY